MLAPGDTVLVALSGGPDSTCLLDVLARLAPSLDVDIHVAHVDHGLAPGSGEVAARVSQGAAAAGYDVHVSRAPELEGPNLQARARAFRYAFLETVAAQIGDARVATGHTLDDRVETTLARLLHGAGTAGLAGLPAVEGARIRPLIEARRAETRAYCEATGLTFHDDPANRDERFERVAVRHRLVAAIQEHWGPGAVRAVATATERLAEDASALSGLADRLYPSLARQEVDGVSFARAEIEALPRALRRRVLEHAVGRVRDRAGGIDAALDGLERAGGAEARFAVAGGSTIVLSEERVEVLLPATSRGGDADSA